MYNDMRINIRICEDEAVDKMTKQTDDNLTALLNPQEKISLTTGRGFWNTAPIDKLGINSVTFADGPLGLRKEVKGGTLPQVALPCVAKLACSFDATSAAKYGAVVGEQARAENVDVVLGPAVNIKRDPRAGRNFEYFSEDPLLAATLASAYIEGVTSQGVGVCVKHFAANNQEYGRHVCDSVVDERALREIYLSVFERVIKESNPCAVMCAYNRLNGEYCSQHKWLLTDVLRNEWGFKGLVMSDWGATDDRVKGIASGLDLEMPQGDVTAVTAALENGALDASDLDVAAQRVIDLSKQFKTMSARTQDVDKQREFARRLSAECTVLVKNNCSLLPFDTDGKIAVIGALAETPVYQGGGSSAVNAESHDSLLAAFAQAGVDCVYAKAYNADGTENDGLIDEAVDVSASADKVILVVGCPQIGEGFDMEQWSLPANQLRAIDAVTSANSNVVIVLQCASSIDTSFSHSAKAMLIDYYGGQSDGQALYDVIFGATAPQGRLAETWYLNLPDTLADFGKDYRRALYRESIYVGYRYTSTANVDVAFPFGYGLSYSDFKWSEPTITRRDKTKITVNVTVTNMGSVADSEVVQVYSTNCDCRDFVEKKKLIGFAKVSLRPREKKTVTVTVPITELQHFDVKQGKFVLNGGKYLISVGKNVCDERYVEEYVVNADNDTADRSNEHACYYDIDENFRPSDEQFLPRYGKPLAEPSLAVNVSTPLADIGNGLTAKIVKNKFTRNMDARNAKCALATPLRNFVSPHFTREMLLTVVDMLNGAVFKNLWKLFTQYLSAKKASKRR